MDANNHVAGRQLALRAPWESRASDLVTGESGTSRDWIRPAADAVNDTTRSRSRRREGRLYGGECQVEQDAGGSWCHPGTIPFLVAPTLEGATWSALCGSQDKTKIAVDSKGDQGQTRVKCATFCLHCLQLTEWRGALSRTQTKVYTTVEVDGSSILHEGIGGCHQRLGHREHGRDDAKD